MKPDSTHDSFDQDPVLDDFFQIRDLAPSDFADRTLEAVRTHQRRRRARIYQISGWTTALAASLALLVGLSLTRPTAEPGLAAVEPPPVAQVAAATDDRDLPQPALANHSAQDLTDLLYAALSETDQVMLYGHASELETLLEEAIALADDENLHTLDMLILLAGGPSAF